MSPSTPPPSTSRLPNRLGPSVLALVLLTTVPARCEWPQWRGPEGLGVSGAPEALPETWQPGAANIRWRTEIPGEGISSPIVSNGRVFVTTAYRGSQVERQILLMRGSALVLAGLVLLLAVGRRWWHRLPASARETPPAKPAGVARLDGWIVSGASLGFALMALALSLGPEAFLPSGNPGRVWRITGGVALIGLAAAVGWFKRDSAWRAAGVAAVLLLTVPFLAMAPSGALGSFRLSKGLPLIVPAVALACWYLFSLWHARTGPRRGVAEGRRHSLVALPLVLLALLLFMPHNFLNGLDRVVVCLDLETGELLWEKAVLRGPQEQKWPRSSYATPTPVADGEHVYAYFGHGMGSVDFDGEVRWSRRFPDYSQSTRYGAGASPIMNRGSVIVVREQESFQDGSPSWIAAFDKESGRPMWRIEPQDAHDSYSTPLLLRAGPADQLLTASWEALVAYDADSGERLWSHEYPMQQMVASMARSGDLLALSGGTTGDKRLVVMRVHGEGADTNVEVLWQTNRGVASIASPVLYDGRLFTVSTPGVMTCYEAETGRMLWKQRLDGEYFSSLVAGDGKVYATNTGGATTVVAASGEFSSIAVNELHEPVYASPAISGCLLIRTASHLYCVDPEPVRAHS